MSCFAQLIFKWSKVSAALIMTNLKFNVYNLIVLLREKMTVKLNLVSIKCVKLFNL
jgi:hypothetical protein